MAQQSQDSAIYDAVELLKENVFDGVAEPVTVLMNAAMVVERSEYLGARPYERTDDRRGYANGFKGKTVKTRLGELPLKVPQTRDCEFYPQSLEKGLRSERALLLSIAEMYVQGVSTRRVKRIDHVFFVHLRQFFQALAIAALLGKVGIAILTHREQVAEYHVVAAGRGIDHRAAGELHFVEPRHHTGFHGIHLQAHGGRIQRCAQLVCNGFIGGLAGCRQGGTQCQRQGDRSYAVVVRSRFGR